MKNQQHIIIVKATGEKEVFDMSKLRQSIRRSGASNEVIDQLVQEMKGSISNGMSTRQIYSLAYTLLRKINKINALKYKLKQALLEMGETGFPFEHLVGELFRRQGYSVTVGQIVEGRCVKHEVDVIATKQTEQIIIECKYSTNQGKHVGVQVPLYVASRVEDIVLKRKIMPEYKGFSFVSCVATNTRFSSDALDYARCISMNLIGWDYPNTLSLKAMLEKWNVFPVTILHHLQKKEKQFVMEQGIVTCKQLEKNMVLLDKLGIADNRKKIILNELKEMSM
jgi:hypothetical protein